MDQREQSHTGARLSGRDPALPSLLGDALCLDFVNTVSDRTTSTPIDTLRGYADLVQWSWHAHLIDAEGRDVLLSRSQGTPTTAATIFTGAIDFREAIYRVFAAAIAEQTARLNDLAVINDNYAAALAAAHLTFADDRYDWAWESQAILTHLDAPLWPIARSAVELLTSAHLTRVKQCPGTNDCGWLFLDTSKNGTRRWCSMEGCGSRAKMRRLYARRKARSFPSTEDRP